VTRLDRLAHSTRDLLNTLAAITRHFCHTLSHSYTIVASLSATVSRVVRTRCPGHAHAAENSATRRSLEAAATTTHAGVSSAVHRR
jgi:hypothetical protein